LSLEVSVFAISLPSVIFSWLVLLVFHRTCYWYNEGNNPQNQVQKYFDLLGDDWNVARIFGGLSATLSFYVFCYLLSFVCSSQVRGARYFNIFFMCCILTTLQGLTFFIFRSELCSGDNCIFGRGAGFSVAAIFAFLMAGLCFLITKDYPGDRDLGIMKEQQVNKSGFSTDVDEEDGPPTKEASKVGEDDMIKKEEVNPAEEHEEDIIEEEVEDEYDVDDNEPQTKNATNLQSVDSRFNDAEA
jgi:hypothetical protein